MFDSPCTQFFREVVFPAVRISGTNKWQARVPEPLLQFLESWERLLHHSALQTILDNIVFPKLSSTVDSWDPRRETTPIHEWVHPWLPWLWRETSRTYREIERDGFKQREIEIHIDTSLALYLIMLGYDKHKLRPLG